MHNKRGGMTTRPYGASALGLGALWHNLNQHPGIFNSTNCPSQAQTSTINNITKRTNHKIKTKYKLKI